MISFTSRLSKGKFISGLLILISTALFGEIRFEPDKLIMPAESLSEFEESVTVINEDSRVLQIDLISTNPDWHIEPSVLFIEAYSRGEFTIRGMVSQADDGLSVLMLSERDDVPYLYSIMPLSGEIQDKAAEARDSGLIEPFLLFYSPGCELCDLFYDFDLPVLEEELGLMLRPQKMNIYESVNFELLQTLSSERGKSIVDFPILIAGNKIFSGEKGLREDFPAILRENKAALFSEEESKEFQDDALLPRLRWLPVFLAGLLDGINPCAFSSLIFLISYLRLLNKKGLEILKIGGSFTFAVFLTYFLIGLGAFSFIRMADSFSIVSSLIRYILGTVLLVLAFLTIIDYIRIRQGRASESILQLSGESKKRIHRVVRQSSRSSLIYLSSFGAGFLISLYELGCTGQIYLPMLVYMVRQENWTALGPLLLYNIAFILPLLLVFFIFYKVGNSQKISEIFQRKMGLIKLLSGGLFLVMGIFILFF